MTANRRRMQAAWTFVGRINRILSIDWRNGRGYVMIL
jgi:hypothetical protein